MGGGQTFPDISCRFTIVLQGPGIRELPLSNEMAASLRNLQIIMLLVTQLAIDLSKKRKEKELFKGHCPKKPDGNASQKRGLEAGTTTSSQESFHQ